MLKLQLGGRLRTGHSEGTGSFLLTKQMTDFFAFFYSVISQEYLAAPHKKSY